MKKYLITGLVILLPLALTIFVVSFIFNLLTEPFVDLAKRVLDYFGVFTGGFLFLNTSEAQRVVSKVLIIIFLIAFTLLLGALTQWVLIRYLLKFWDFILHRIPFVRTVYRVSQDVINTLFSKEANSFKQVVLVPFPHTNSHCIGFITRDNLPPLTDPNGEPQLSVFVPTTPNPTSGFLIVMERKQLVFLTISVEDAFKFIFSCGTITNNFPKTFSANASDVTPL